MKKHKIEYYGQVIGQNVINKVMKVLTIVNEIDYYDFPGLTPDIKRKGCSLSFFTIDNKSINVSKKSTDFLNKK